MDLEFKKSPKEPVPRSIAWICSFCYMLIIGIIFVMLSTEGFFRLGRSIFTLNFSILNTLDVVLLAVTIVVIIFLIFCLNHYEWFLNPRLRKKGNSLIFETDDVIAALGKSTTKSTINTVKRYDIKKNSIIVVGEIEVKEPLGKSHSKSKCEIVGLYDNDDKVKVIDILEDTIKCQND